MIRRSAAVLLLLATAHCGGEPEPAGPFVHVDADGFFVMAIEGDEAPAPASGTWRRGAGVRSVILGSGPPAGRLETGIDEATLYRVAGGATTPIRFGVRPAPDGVDPRATFCARLDTWARRAEDATGAAARLLPLLGDPSPPAALPGPPSLAIATGDAPPAEGADLAAWAPAELVFARSRSVTAAFRMAGELERLLDLHALRQGRASDHGTLRLTLHHLLLPTIWNTNPGAETGVSEVGVVIAPPFAPGELRAAVLFRIEDPELHFMQTMAGVSQESQPDHLWRPEDDPFPESRIRHPHRSVVGDVEVVATDEDLHDLLVAGVAHRMADDAGYLTARAAAGRQVIDEALFVYVPAGVDRPEDRLAAARRRALREEAGWRFLARGWGAPVAPEPTGVLSPEIFAEDAAPPPSWLDGIAWMRFVTDPEGAMVSLGLRGDVPDAASTWWSPEDVPGTACDGACGGHRSLLGDLARLDRRSAADPERAFVVLGNKPACPLGGTFTVHPLDDSVRCTTHGGAGKPKPGDGLPSPVRDVTTTGDAPGRVTFRLEIDWRRRQ